MRRFLTYSLLVIAALLVIGLIYQKNIRNDRQAMIQQQEPSVTPSQTTYPKRPTSSLVDDLPMQTATPTSIVLTPDEQAMLNLINHERRANGLQPLRMNPQLTKLARIKAKDMIDYHYFSHQSPRYGSPFDMMRRFNVTYRTAGENIAGNPSVQNAHHSLMRSPGHRANILKPSFTEVGIGIIKGGPYGKMYVQMFKG